VVDKISLNIKVLSLNLEHNFFVPSEMNVSNATGLIVQSLGEEYPGTRQSTMRKNVLIQMSTGKVLNPGCSFKQLGIVQGEKLLLV